jgi:hypothetical protein
MKDKDYSESFESNDFWLLMFIAAAIVFFVLNSIY